MLSRLKDEIFTSQKSTTNCRKACGLYCAYAGGNQVPACTESTQATADSSDQTARPIKGNALARVGTGGWISLAGEVISPNTLTVCFANVLKTL